MWFKNKFIKMCYYYYDNWQAFGQNKAVSNSRLSVSAFYMITDEKLITNISKQFPFSLSFQSNSGLRYKNGSKASWYYRIGNILFHFNQWYELLIFIAYNQVLRVPCTLFSIHCVAFNKMLLKKISSPCLSHISSDIY